MDSTFIAGLTKLRLDPASALGGGVRRDDDFADRFNHTLTCFLLLAFTLVVSARQYIGKPIACWVPAEFTRAHEEYTESVCWVMSTYFVPPSKARIPVKIEARENHKMTYYQWVPFILMLQALGFSLPCVFWRMLNWTSGVHVSVCNIECCTEIDVQLPL